MRLDGKNTLLSIFKRNTVAKDKIFKYIKSLCSQEKPVQTKIGCAGKSHKGNIPLPCIHNPKSFSL